MNDLSKQEALVDECVKQGDTESAVRVLFDLIEAYAKQKNFPKAEMLRERLFDVDPMALTEIIKSAEIIEEEKSESLDQKHLDIWSDLYDTLTTEETHALYFALQEQSYDTNETIFKQGKKNARLYFINQGQLKLIYDQKGSERLLKTIGPGTVVGDDTFFSITVCTSSLVTLSRVKLSFLEKDSVLTWQEEFPSLSNKLRDYCTKMRQGDDAGEQVDRRVHERISVAGHVMYQILDNTGKAIGGKVFKGDLSDISAGGASFFITTNHKNARLLLGRKLKIRLSIKPADEKQPPFQHSGQIIGVINQLYNDYSIHMKFDKLLPEKEIATLKKHTS